MTSVPLATELRLALAMRGGVSLSVWIGGAVREIEQFRSGVVLGVPSTSSKAPNALACTARATGYERVEIDVISGASAGGLNAVILGAAMTNGKKLDMLRDVWLDSAAIEKLLYRSTHEARNSILDGNYFYDELVANLTKLMSSESTEPELVAERLDVLLSVTSIVPNAVSAEPDPTARVTEQRIDGQIHLRRRPQRNQFDPACVADLAFSARATASFPVAFEPVMLEPGRMAGEIDFRPERPDPLLLFDGGVSDNMPVGKAARAIESAPANGPTDRLLLYLHPSPGVPDAGAARREIEARAALRTKGARPFDVVRSTLRSLRTKSLVEDLQALEAHNAAVEEKLSDRDRLLEPLAHPPPSAPLVAALGAVLGATADHLGDVTGASGPVAPELDAERLVDLFVRPWDHVAELDPPREFPSRTPGRSGADLEHLRRALRTALADVQLPGVDQLPALSRHSLRPWGALIRSASLLIEWCRWGEDHGAKSSVNPRKRELYELRAAAVGLAAELNCQTLLAVPVLPSDPATAAALIVEERCPFVRDQIPLVVAQWERIARITVELRSVIPHAAPELGTELPWVFDQLLHQANAPADAQRALDRMDEALLPMHRGEPTGSLDHIRYLTISGNAGTPLADCYQWPVAVEAPEPRFASIRAMPRERREPDQQVSIDHSRSDASSKLAGSQLHNFSAFLERSWRANDWMWGQIDAAATLVDLVLEPTRLSKMAVDDRSALADRLRETCTAPVRTPGGDLHPWSGAIVSTATRLWNDETTELVRAELTSSTASQPVPPVARVLLLWRRHVEIVAAELVQDAADSPTGQPAAATLAEAMGQWDDGSRQLSERWGEKKITALGMRATFVGWRALFARVKRPISLIRLALAPILAPVVGFALCRRRTSVAFEIFLLGCVMPRVADSPLGRIAAAGAGVLFAVWWLLLTRDATVDSKGKRRKRFDLHQDPWSIVTVVFTLAVVAEAVVARSSWFRDLLPTPDLPGRGITPYLLPVAAVAAATFVTWYWAKWPWRVLVTVVNGAIVWFWVYLGAVTRVGRLDGFSEVGNRFGSFWWAIVAMILVTTLLGYNVDLADLDSD
jgi:predicted acylesterase/phospholipase RssA